MQIITAKDAVNNGDIRRKLIPGTSLWTDLEKNRGVLTLVLTFEQIPREPLILNNMEVRGFEPLVFQKPVHRSPRMSI